MTQMGKKAMVYMRVSGAGQVQQGGFDRQMDSAESFARQKGYELVKFFSEAHTGTEAIRPVFAEMLEELLGNGCRIIIVESLDRLARDLTIQLQLVALLASKGITLMSATTGQDVTADMNKDPMMRAMIQIQGVFAELEKNLLVRKLRKARERKRKLTGSCEGGKAYGYRPGEADIVKLIVKLSRKPRGGKKLGNHQIAMRLNNDGHLTRHGRGWTGVQILRILSRQAALSGQ